uniref:NADH-ubiquinone oxidoreductase chain 1 n=1 Tax=Urodontus glabratus TaxID=1205599 RepID=A0A0S2MSJ0_9CUCU|nr:NADH deshydrogenase subunit 1 [Urodontus glabratus]
MLVFKDLILLFLLMLILIVCVLVGVAFLTLLERKVLGYVHLRKGPNKLGVLGILQPFSDAIKLFSKEQTVPSLSNFNIYYISPIFSLLIALFIWQCMPFFSVYLNFNLSILFFLSVSSLGVYMIMMAGWSSNSSYAMLGGLRSVAQSISYEVTLVLILLSFMFMILSTNILDLMKYQENIWMVFFMFPLSMMWLVTSLAETNRTPFDFAEGESELVSGFNVEYSSGSFAMIFLAEYASILFMSMMCVMLFLGGNLLSLGFFVKIVFFAFVWIWVRGTLPRYRYDKLMNLAWKSYLLISLNFLFFYMGYKIFLFFLMV